MFCYMGDTLGERILLQQLRIKSRLMNFGDTLSSATFRAPLLEMSSVCQLCKNLYKHIALKADVGLASSR